MSEENLTKDKFFHDMICKDIEGYFDINVILSCNNIKKLTTSIEEVQQALSTSTEVELSQDKTKVRRAGNKPLPELKLLQNKRKAEKEDKETPTKGNKEFDDESDLTILMIIAVKGDTDIKWQKIKDYFEKENLNLNVIYFRFNKNEGNIAVTKDKSEVEVKFRDELKIEGVDFKISKCEGEDLINFYKDHGSHLEFCLSKKKGGKRQSKGNNKDKFKLRNPVELGGETFIDTTNIKARCRKILNTHKEGELLDGKDKDFMQDLLKFDKKVDKLTDLKGITTGQLTQFFSKTFFALKNDDTKNEFSAFKCIDWLQIAQNKKKDK